MSGSLITVSEEDRRINEVLRHMWRYIHTYTIRFLEKVSKNFALYKILSL